jgi:hypothetical protein
MPFYPNYFKPRNTIKAIYLLATYTYSSSHEFLSDVNSHDAGVAADVLTTTFSYIEPEQKVVIDLSDIEFTSVTETNLGYILLYEDTGVAGTSKIVGYLDIRENGLGRDLVNATGRYVFDSTGAFEVRF